MWVSQHTLHGLIGRALGDIHYRRNGATSHEWDISGSCQAPMTRELVSRPLRVRRDLFMGRGAGVTYSMVLHVRCRRCEACCRLKSAQWRARASDETHRAARTWFGTITISPATHYRLIAVAAARLADGGTVYESLSAAEQFDEVMRELGSETTKYIKRVRAESGAALKYIVVAERHASGVPHLHMLVHEVDRDRPVRERTLSKQWAALGFVKWRLVHDRRAAAYVCKYIAKSPLARVRASVRYGRQGQETHENAKLAGNAGNVEKKAPKKGTIAEACTDDQSGLYFGLTSCGKGEYGWHIPNAAASMAGRSDCRDRIKRPDDGGKELAEATAEVIARQFRKVLAIIDEQSNASARHTDGAAHRLAADRSCFIQGDSGGATVPDTPIAAIGRGND